MYSRLSFFGLLIAIFLNFLPGKIAYAAESGILFSEVSMGSSTNASDEFIELFNSSGSDIDLSGWQISYKSATGTTWYKKAVIENGKVLAPNSYYLAATLVEADTKMSSGLSQTGGNIRITDTKGNIADQLAWGNGDKPLIQSALAPIAGESLQRIYNTNGLGLQNTVNNFNDFEISSLPTPDKPPQFNPNNENEDQLSNNNTYPNLMITEIFPDPASPQTDSNDEFIEIYNPNNFDVNLKSWSLRDNSNNIYAFADQIIGANLYLVISSKDTSISLNNDGDIISLFNPLGQAVDQTADYGKAEEGLSWGLTTQGWGWTVAPTPGTTNSALYVKGEESANSAKTSSKKKAKSIGSKKSKIASEKKSKKPKIASIGKKGNDSSFSNNDGIKNRNLWNWLLIALGAGTIGYGIYEYRPEIKSYYHIIRRKLSAWRSNR
ncbi:MAG: lamin tail domain-containing protein [bacterium]|nr:lamin tail domain-containing protein [bacterium]